MLHPNKLNLDNLMLNLQLLARFNIQKDLN